jgi:hypothetical protein
LVSLTGVVLVAAVLAAVVLPRIDGCPTWFMASVASAQDDAPGVLNVADVTVTSQAAPSELNSSSRPWGVVWFAGLASYLPSSRSVTCLWLV